MTVPDIKTFPDWQMLADPPRVYLDRPGKETLYHAASGLEKALADCDAERLIRIYAEAIIDVWDPFRISYKNLPYLSWAMGVNMWQDAWRETTKRTWTARQWTFKSLRGTANGTRMAVDYISRDVTPFGYQCTKFTVPPQRVYSGATLTKEEREEWLKLMPQVRVWRSYEKGHADFGKAFYGGSGMARVLRDHRFCLGSTDIDAKLACITPSTAIDRLQRRARYVVRGVETDIRVSDFGEYFRVHLRSIEDGSVFVSRPIRPVHPKRYYIPTTAPKRLITVIPRQRLSWRVPVWATAEPLTAEPEREVYGSTRRRSVFCDVPMRWYKHDYYVPSDAWSRIYDRYAINDGTVEQNSRRPVQIMGTGRYGFPKYTAWIGMSLRSIRRWAVFNGPPNRHYFQPHDPTPVKRAKTAVQASKKIADRILLELGPVPSFVAGRPFLAQQQSYIVGRTI